LLKRAPPGRRRTSTGKSSLASEWQDIVSYGSRLIHYDLIGEIVADPFPTANLYHCVIEGGYIIGAERRRITSVLNG
jgi:hypothetical protein